MAEIKLDDEQISRALDSAIMTALGEQGKQAIIDSAIKHLTTKPADTSYYGDRRTPLQQIMHRAAEDVARSLILNKLKEDAEFIKAVEDVFTLATQKWLSVENRENLANKLCDALSKAFSRDY